MTKDHAIQAMYEGHKVTHTSFTSNEWMKLSELGYEFEDGILCTEDEFWYFRTDNIWLTGWSIVK